MSEQAPSTEKDPIFDNEDLSAWEKLQANKERNDVKDIIDDEEQSDWEKLHALKALGHGAVEKTAELATVSPESAKDLRESAAEDLINGTAEALDVESPATPAEFVEGTDEYEDLNDKIHDGAEDIISQIDTDRFGSVEDFAYDSHREDDRSADRGSLKEKVSGYFEERKHQRMIKERAKNVKKIREQKKNEQKEAVANSHKAGEGKVSAKDLLSREGINLIKKDRIGRTLLRKIKEGVISLRARKSSEAEPITSDENSESSYNYDEFVARNQQETLAVNPESEQSEETPTAPVNTNRGEETPESTTANDEADLRAAVDAVNARAEEQTNENLEEAA